VELNLQPPAPDAPPVFLPRATSWYVGLDLGQAQDPTAIAVLERIKGVLDPNSEYERHTCTGRLPQRPAERVNVRHLERLKLGISYPSIVQHVKELLARPPLCGDVISRPAELIIDSSGVGRPVADLFTEAGIEHQGITITAGSEAVHAGRRNQWNVAKTILVSTVDAMLHTGTLRFAEALTEAGTMREELESFRRKLSDAGRATYQARTGAHDDLVLAVAVACWWISRPPPPVVQFGVYGTPDKKGTTYGW
jgi:hypothetical protein